MSINILGKGGGGDGGKGAPLYLEQIDYATNNETAARLQSRPVRQDSLTHEFEKTTKPNQVSGKQANKVGLADDFHANWSPIL